uniref:MACPF domain-containing protein n=1 Tax=Bicosoecida sp. CB-2014 TaxID=1486930 RepID=A0A7S1C5P8_9STRA|mmetsp:Transcript_14792/g.51539  ORF Transcript_14792/g.51539 Transcript_14792/m.51539 type:complete len:379 (+) Transcript_14792:59-1195(+)
MHSKLLAVAALALVGSAVAMPPVLPCADTMSRGFDMLGGVQNGTTGGKQLLPVFQFHYTEGQIWSDPSDPSLTFSVPDELVATNVDSSTEYVNEGIMSTYDDWVHTEQKSFNVNAGVSMQAYNKSLSLNFKYNRESFTYKERTSTDNAASGFSKHEWALLSLESYPPQLMPINPMFSKFVDELPASVRGAADQAKYNQLVQYWGTHFPTYANFGGHVHVNTFVNKSFLATKSTSWVQNQFSLTFHYWMFDISGGGFTNRSDIHIDNAFKEAATTYIFFRGGDLTLQSNATVDAWLKTIPANPLYLNVTLSDLSTLVTDAGKATNLQKTITHYLNTGEMPTEADDFDYDAFYASIEVPEGSLEMRGVDLETPPRLRGSA